MPKFTKQKIIIKNNMFFPSTNEIMTVVVNDLRYDLFGSNFLDDLQRMKYRQKNTTFEEKN